VTRFHSPQCFPFRFELTEESSPVQIVATRGDGGFCYQVSSQEWKFLEDLIGRGEAVPTEEEDDLEFWRQVLDYTPADQICFMKVPRHDKPLPEELFVHWPENTRYEYDIWARDRRNYEFWLELVRQTEAGLGEEMDWTTHPPDDKALLSAEFLLHLSVPNRGEVYRRLHALGILALDDGGEKTSRLESLGCFRMAAWRRAALLHRWVSPLVDGAWPEGCTTPASSPLGLEWFLDGPYQQRFLDPLHHLKFGMHHHIKGKPSTKDSSFVVSMGGRISGAFLYQLGPWGLPQLVRGGEPPPDSPLHPYYQYELTGEGDRVAELAARAVRQGYFKWGACLAHHLLLEQGDHGQCWVELGVALWRLGRPGLGKTCLVMARETGHDFRVDGELRELWECEGEELGEPARVYAGWEGELQDLDLEELTAAALCYQVRKDPVLWEVVRRIRTLPRVSL